MVRQVERSAATTNAILSAARTLFSERGYDDVTIDQIAERAGCKKGAIYHHFDSKRSIFDRVLDGVQANLAVDLAKPVERAFAARSPHGMAQCIQMYLQGANSDDVRQILLIDGPVVLGWKRWRDIDERHFAGIVLAGISILMEGVRPRSTIELATRLTLGAIMETALACSTAADPVAAAAKYCRPFELMLNGFVLAQRAR